MCRSGAVAPRPRPRARARGARAAHWGRSPGRDGRDGTVTIPPGDGRSSAAPADAGHATPADGALGRAVPAGGALGRAVPAGADQADAWLADAGLAGGAGGVDRLRSLVAIALDGLAAGTTARGGPLPPGGPADVTGWVHDALTGRAGPGHASGAPGARARPVPSRWTLPAEGIGASAALSGLARMLARGAVDPADPACAAHLHCPPLAVAVAADLVVSALNPSLDSWDQAPAATALETEVVATLAGLVGFDPAVATGAITTGGTASNLTALMLARDTLRASGPAPSAPAPSAPAPSGSAPPGTASSPPGTAPSGPLPPAPAPSGPVPPGASVGGTGALGQPAVRVFCSSAAHFSIGRAAAVLGLEPDAVVPVVTDGAHRLDPSALDTAVSRARHDAGRVGRRLAPVVVATAGTTDVGAIDPLRAVAEVARAHGAWLHVDAAYGGGALLSDRLAPLLDGIAEADSVALDLHKLGWQPIAAGVLLTRDASGWAALADEVAYLNAADDTLAGYPSLLGRSLRTSRRADAFKIAVTLQALGRHGLGRLVDACHDLARHAAARISAHPRLELAAPVTLSTVVFRYLPAAAARRPPAATDRPPAAAADGYLPVAATGGGPAAGPAAGSVDVDGINARLRRRLLDSGRAVVGRTELGPDRSVHLKLTLLNPAATASDVDALLSAVIEAGDAEDRG
ncbi:pyridoxal-dependent decarboxylase [Frankia sp. CiP1_Cm_nod1]|uniref:pyridoxal-dependent decarboxylase n=1 Tax=Frankia sp. CiP1_Cm_nod1 TaxID=2897160 RepID=UPI0020243F74